MLYVMDDVSIVLYVMEDVMVGGDGCIAKSTYYVTRSICIAVLAD